MSAWHMYLQMGPRMLAGDVSFCSEALRRLSDAWSALTRPRQTPPTRCDYLLLVATDSELEALRTAAVMRGLDFAETSGRFGTYYAMGPRAIAVKTEMGPLSYGGSASRALHYQAETQATALISVGMAFGIDSTRQRIGDVLISTMVLPYDNKDVRAAQGGHKYDYSRVKAFPAKQSLLTLLRRAADTDTWRTKVHFGALLSGASRIFEASYRDTLAKGCKRKGEPVIGGEMEGVGLLSVSPREAPTWIIAKGICDFADEHRDCTISTSRPLACTNAAVLVLDAIYAQQLHGEGSDVIL